MDLNIIEPVELIEPININQEISGVNQLTKFCNEGYLCMAGEIIVD